MFEIRNLTKKFKNKIVLSDISLSLENGVYGLLGANGAGKTTLLRCITQLYPECSSSVFYNNKGIADSPEILNRIGYLPQEFDFLKDLTVFESMMLLSNLKGVQKKKAINDIENVLQLVNLVEDMAKMVFEEVWKNHTDCISETIKIIKRCYRENKVENNQKKSIMFQIEKIKSKKNILLDMRTSGEITKDEFLEQKEVLNKKLSLLESELKNCFEIDTKQIQIDYDEILKSLNEIVDFSNPKMDRELLQRFIAKVVPNGENHFIWYLNLDGKSDTRLNVNIVGNKKNAIVSIDESGDISPLHTSDILYFNDEKSFTVETLHRLQSQRRTNNQSLILGNPNFKP